ncbi:MAG TPA: SsrA-binding protein SmpB [Candidatus Angelobacter sp.]|jgi:SsrA-binding protein|nr:SsrA-binding protein SmpB [Candidatus Angelobacter sp.]
MNKIKNTLKNCIKNRRASFEYEFIEEYVAGIQLLGTEIKSIRQNKASISESFCLMKNGELYAINIYISEYRMEANFNHIPNRSRKLLLNKKELIKISKKSEKSGLTIIPNKLFINQKGYAKLQIFLAKGRKIFDKREVIKKRENKRDRSRFCH